MTNEADLPYALGFNLVEGIGAARVRTLLEVFGSWEAAWRAPRRELQRIGLDRRALASLLKVREEIDLEREVANLAHTKTEVLTWQSAAYPPLLKNISFAPPVLFCRGRLLPGDARSLAIVGTRRHTAYGRQIAQELAVGLVGCGITVVSGLARGIDTIVHETVLEHGGRTVAVLGSGVDVIYPPENRQVVKRLLASDQGAVLSDYPMGTQPAGKNFPPRNRIVSGMTWGTIVIEGDVKSGAMITAKFALEQGREVFAVPGSINSPASRGPHWLVQQGAKLVTGLDDILEELHLGCAATVQPMVQLALPESAEEAALLPHLSNVPQHVDELCRLSGLPTGLVTSTLVLLELKGVVLQQEHMVYTRR